MINELKTIEMQGKMVLTTKQIAEGYGTTKDTIIWNFNHNRSKYVLGKHYIVLSGEELKQFKNWGENFSLVGKNAKTLYLWTEKGALLHAKSINTDKAWEVYDYLVDHYFRTKAAVQEPVQTPKPHTRAVVDIPVNQEAQKVIKELRDDISGIEAVLKLYNRYLPEESYVKTLYVLEQLCMSVADRGYWIGKIKPMVIEKAQ